MDKSIMQGAVDSTRSKCIILPNDIEMMLNAQGKATKWFVKTPESGEIKTKHPTWQSYKSYKEGVYQYIISEVIRSK